MTAHLEGREREVAAPVTGTSPAADPGPVGTGSGGTRALGLLTLAAIALLAVLAFVASPADAQMGDNVRLIYVHVPVVVAAYVAIMITTVGAVMVLWKHSRWWDLVSSAAAEVATLFTALTLVTGMIWGRPTWGVYWVWDARLTSTAMLFLLLLGYLAVRRTSFDPEVRARRSAIVGLLLLPNVLIVNRSVEWWRSLHQEPTLFKLNPTIEGLQLFTLVFGMATAALVLVWLIIHRFRLGWLQEQVDAQDLDVAIDARRSEVDR